MNPNRPSMKLLGDLVLALLITGAVVLIGLALMTQGGSKIKTAVKAPSMTASPTPTPTFGLVKDWETIDAPSDAADLLEGVEVCPSPNPTPTGTSEPQSTSGVVLKDSDGQERVLGEKIAVLPRPTITPECVMNFQGALPNDYKLGEFSEKLIEVQVKATDAQRIIKTICMGSGQKLPDCSSSSVLGCVSVETASFEYKEIGLVEAAGELVRFVKETVKVTDPATGNSAYTTAVYAAAPGDADEVDVTFKMSQYALGAVQKTALSNVHPKLLEIGENVLARTKVHEIKHWDIFKKFLLKYFGVMNGPKVPDGQFTFDKAKEEMANNFKKAWAEVAKLENAEHKSFHKEEHERWQPTVKDIPLDGWDGIYCEGVKDLIVSVSVYSVGGTCSVEMIAEGSGTNNSEDATGMFFKGSDINIKCVANNGYEFIGWEEDPFGDGNCPVVGSIMWMI